MTNLTTKKKKSIAFVSLNTRFLDGTNRERAPPIMYCFYRGSRPPWKPMNTRRGSAGWSCAIGAGVRLRGWERARAAASRGRVERNVAKEGTRSFGRRRRKWTVERARVGGGRARLAREAVWMGSQGQALKPWLGIWWGVVFGGGRGKERDAKEGGTIWSLSPLFCLFTG